MPRDVFPYEGEREVIRRFLGGATASADYSAESGLRIMNGCLELATLTVAWYDSAGSLCVKLLAGYWWSYSSGIIEEVAKQLGMGDVKVVREDDPHSPGGTQWRTFLYFLADTPLAIDQPTVLCGPVSVQAYRASVKAGGSA